MKIEIEGTEEEVRRIAASIGCICEQFATAATAETTEKMVELKEAETIVGEQGKEEIFVDAAGRKYRNKEQWKKNISVSMKEVHRKKHLLQLYGKQTKQSITDPVVEDRVPKMYTKKFHHKTHASPVSHSARHWLQEEEEKLKAFYFDPQNHFADGTVKGEAMMKFAESINRTKGAVKVHIINVSLNKKLVRDGQGVRKKLTPETVKLMHDYAAFSFKPAAEAKAKDIMEFFRHLTSQNGTEAREDRKSVV